MTDYTAKFPHGIKVPAFTQGPAPKELPSWLDKEKFRKGQRFAYDHAFGTIMCETMSLLLLFTFPDALQALIFSGETDTYEKAKMRYTSTLNRLLNWYKGDIWSESAARRHIEVVRSRHAAVQEKLIQTPTELLTSKTTLTDKCIPLSSTPIVNKGHFQEDMKASVTPPTINQIPSVKYSEGKSCPINQGEILMTQFSFVGLFILHPEKFGAYAATDEDLDGFIHMWRGITYLLGIEDEFNFCSEDLVTVKEQSRQVLERWLIPSLLTVSQDWEHMSRCMVSPFNDLMDLESLLFYTCNTILGIPMPRFYASLGWRSRFNILFLDFVLRKVLPIRPLRHAFNWFIEKIARRVQKTPENKSCPYSQFIQNKIL